MPADQHLDFDYRALTGTYDPAQRIIDPGELHYGLALQIEYVHGILTGPDGTVTWVEQKFSGALSAGTFVQTDAGGEMAARSRPLGGAAVGDLDPHPPPRLESG